ncbi:MAG: DEAD/DEAH box helicase [Candidatus Coatesbacteria bacterium]
MVRLAAEYHDLGKLDGANQRVLQKHIPRTSSKEPLPINHVDAGVAHLMSMMAPSSALLAYSHHRGLPCISIEERKRENGGPFRDEKTEARTGKFLAEYLAIHRTQVAGSATAAPRTLRNATPMEYRIALSCLVDADHTDTGCHRTGSPFPSAPPLLPKLRLEQLDSYVQSLGERHRGARDRLRAAIYDACRNAPVDPPFRACDSPVGTGKTTAVMAHMLSVAAARGLRRIFVVLPYTNIITQSVSTYRKALTAPGEAPTAVVAEHHHRAESEHLALRDLSARWDAPIVVTTAVQFFETLAAAHPSGLRKLHQIPGSGILIDEAHAALPAHLWPMAWHWLQELVEKWDCSVVLSSGSLARFWEIRDFSGSASPIPDLVPDALREEAHRAETGRINYQRADRNLDHDALVSEVLKAPGPRLVIMNTVQAAAVIANELRAQVGRGKVEHMSTALTPHDRDPIVSRVLARLGNGLDDDWTFVATSCAEAGLDLSFRTAFRESAGLVHLIQVGGRANREARDSAATVHDFQTADPLLPHHPTFRLPATILGELFREGKVATAHCTEAMLRELRRHPTRQAEDVRHKENAKDFPAVESGFKVIETAKTITIIIDQAVVKAIESGERVDWRTVQDQSVQVWADKMESLPVRPIDKEESLYAWIGRAGSYDTFLGYMASVLPLARRDPRTLII